MSEGELAPNANKARRESLGFKESEVAALLGWPVKKIKDYEAGAITLAPVDEERIKIAIESLVSRKARGL